MTSPAKGFPVVGKRMGHTVSILAEYIEFAVHLMSNSRCASRALSPLSCVSSIRVEQKHGTAVPFFYSQVISLALPWKRDKKNREKVPTMRSLRPSKGLSTNSSILARHPMAFCLKPAPGNQSGRCLTTVDGYSKSVTPILCSFHRSHGELDSVE